MTSATREKKTDGPRAEPVIEQRAAGRAPVIEQRAAGRAPVTEQRAAGRAPVIEQRAAGRAPVIELRGVARRFATPDGEFAALAGVDLQIGGGALVAVTGASGSGKSTLLHLLAGIDRPTAGSVRVAGTEVEKLGESALSGWRGKTVGIVFQFFQLLPTLTALENVLLPMELCKTYAPAAARQRARELLERVGVGDQRDKLPAALSGGQQQRAAIARALANDPPVLLADEPTGNLDSKNGGAVLALLAELAAAGKTVVTVTHERDVARRADRVIELVDGRVAKDGAHA